MARAMPSELEFFGTGTPRHISMSSMVTASFTGPSGEMGNVSKTSSSAGRTGNQQVRKRQCIFSVRQAIFPVHRAVAPGMRPYSETGTLGYT